MHPHTWEITLHVIKMQQDFIQFTKLEKEIETFIDQFQDKELNEARVKKGTLIASGFIAGGALMGVVSAVLKFAGADWFMYDWNKCADGAICSGAEAIAIIPLVLLVIYMIKASLKKD